MRLERNAAVEEVRVVRREADRLATIPLSVTAHHCGFPGSVCHHDR